MSKKQTVRESTKNGIKTRKTVTITRKRVGKGKKQYGRYDWGN